MTKILFSVLLFCTCAAAQVKFEVKSASKLYDVEIEVERCEDKICEGPATFTLFKKNHLSPFQVFKLSDTSFMLGESDQPSANITRLYDEQSAVNFSDYNFDSVEDLALCGGRNGGYGMPSYQIYLFLPRAGRFILSEELTELSQEGRLGMLERDARRKRLRTFSKSGCCLHMTEEFVVVNNRPKKVLEIVEDATIADNKRVKITTKRLIGSRWRTTVKYVPRVSQ
ncbi:MAG TPA: hypothetical protein VFZ40_19060 [Pyrinomonadaceae bacterium]